MNAEVAKSNKYIYHLVIEDIDIIIGYYLNDKKPLKTVNAKLHCKH